MNRDSLNIRKSYPSTVAWHLRGKMPTNAPNRWGLDLTTSWSLEVALKTRMSLKELFKGSACIKKTAQFVGHEGLPQCCQWCDIFFSCSTRLQMTYCVIWFNFLTFMWQMHIGTDEMNIEGCSLRWTKTIDPVRLELLAVGELVLLAFATYHAHLRYGRYRTFGKWAHTRPPQNAGEFCLRSNLERYVYNMVHVTQHAWLRSLHPFMKIFFKVTGKFMYFSHAVEQYRPPIGAILVDVFSLREKLKC